MIRKTRFLANSAASSFFLANISRWQYLAAWIMVLAAAFWFNQFKYSTLGADKSCLQVRIQQIAAELAVVTMIVSAILGLYWLGIAFLQLPVTT